jgi:hypothetical protein
MEVYPIDVNPIEVYPTGVNPMEVYPIEAYLIGKVRLKYLEHQ